MDLLFISGMMPFRISAKGRAKALSDWNLKSWINSPIKSERLPTTNVGGRCSHFWHLPVGVSE